MDLPEIWGFWRFYLEFLVNSWVFEQFLSDLVPKLIYVFGWKSSSISKKFCQNFEFWAKKSRVLMSDSLKMFCKLKAFTSKLKKFAAELIISANHFFSSLLSLQIWVRNSRLWKRAPRWVSLWPKRQATIPMMWLTSNREPVNSAWSLRITQPQRTTLSMVPMVLRTLGPDGPSSDARPPPFQPPVAGLVTNELKRRKSI